MAQELIKSEAASDLAAMSMDQLWEEAGNYGRPNIFASERSDWPECCSCTIEFVTTKHTKLEAKSGFDLTAREALIRSIEAARSIVETVRAIDV
jgi:hypothetical protein